jgi:hypothetical protein
MTWWAWRQVRLPARLLAAVVAAFALLLAWTGPQLADQFAADGLRACSSGLESTGMRTCGDLERDLLGRFSILGAVGGLLTVLPAAVGMLWGAPLLAREYEAGTHRLAWTQSVTRTRWLATRLAVIGAVAVAATAVSSLAFTWWSTSRDQLDSRITPGVFEQRGIVPVAYVAFALALGTAVGSVVRRVVPAATVTLLLAVLALFGAKQGREHLLDPVELRYPTYTFFADEPAGRIGADRGWVLSNRTLDRDGNVISPAGELSDQRAAELCGVSLPDLTKADLDACGRRLGLVDVALVHPADRFWALQAAESALFTAAAVGLVALSFRQVRRHSG